MVKPVVRAQNELYKPVVEVKDQRSQWRGRKISIPSAHAQGLTVVKSKQGIGCIGVICIISIICIIAGSAMWAACDDETSPGCSPAIKISGKALAGSGIGFISLISCVISCLACCAGVAGAMK